MVTGPQAAPPAPDITGFAKVGNEQGPEQPSPSPEVPLYFPHERYQEKPDGLTLMQILNSLQTPCRVFHGNDRALGKWPETSRPDRALVLVGVEESFVRAGTAVAFLIQGNREENVGCCSKKFWS